MVHLRARYADPVPNSFWPMAFAASLIGSSAPWVYAAVVRMSRCPKSDPTSGADTGAHMALGAIWADVEALKARPTTAVTLTDEQATALGAQLVTGVTAGLETQIEAAVRRVLGSLDATS